MLKTLSAIIIGTLVFSAAVSASELEEILKSKEISKYEMAEDKAEITLKSDKWLPPNENFSLLFKTDTGWEYLNLWFDIPATGHFRRHWQHRVTPYQFVESIRAYKTQDDTILKVSVLVPHPRYRESARFGLMKEFSQHVPPQLEVEFTEDTKVQDHKGKLYTLPDGTCQINLGLEKMTLVIFSGPCSHTDELLDFAHQFSFDRFVMKLST